MPPCSSVTGGSSGLGGSLFFSSLGEVSRMQDNPPPSALLRRIIKKETLGPLLTRSSPFPRAEVQCSSYCRYVSSCFMLQVPVLAVRLFARSLALTIEKYSVYPSIPLSDGAGTRTSEREKCHDKLGLSARPFISCCLASAQDVPCNGCLAQILVMGLQSPDFRPTSCQGLELRGGLVGFSDTITASRSSPNRPTAASLRHLSSSRPVWGGPSANANAPLLEVG